jgi:hypothetical protein
MQREKVKNTIIYDYPTGAEFEADVGTSCIRWSGSGRRWQPREKAGVKSLNLLQAGVSITHRIFPLPKDFPKCYANHEHDAHPRENKTKRTGDKDNQLTDQFQDGGVLHVKQPKFPIFSSHADASMVHTV